MAASWSARSLEGRAAAAAVLLLVALLVWQRATSFSDMSISSGVSHSVPSRCAVRCHAAITRPGGNQRADAAADAQRSGSAGRRYSKHVHKLRISIAARLYWAVEGNFGGDLGPWLTCEFRNVYLLPAESHAELLTFEYIAEIPADADAEAERQALAAQLSRVDPLSHRPYDGRLRWKVVIVQAKPNTTSEPLSDTWSARCECVDAQAAPRVPDSGNTEEEDDVLASMLQQCSEPPPCQAGLQISALATYMYIVVGFNLGHTTWDSLMPLQGAFDDLGLGESRGRARVLLYEPGQPPVRGRVRDAIWSQFVHPPVYHAALLRVAGTSPVRFNRLILGLKGRSPHNILPTLTTYGVHDRVVWKYRQSVLGVLGLPTAGAAAAAWPAVTVTFLQKGDKRVITNIADCVRTLNEAASVEHVTADVQVLDWPSVPSFKHEVEQLLRTDVQISVDGTGANNLFFMRPGAVHISLGVHSELGHANMADFLFASFDHVHVLYYRGLSPGGHDAAIELDTVQLRQLFVAALTKLRQGLQRPLPLYANHAEAAFVASHLMTAYPYLAAAGWAMYLAQSSTFTRRLMEQPTDMWTRFVPHVAVPQDLTAAVNTSRDDFSRRFA